MKRTVMGGIVVARVMMMVVVVLEVRYVYNYRLPLVICHGSKNDDSGGNTMMVVVIRVVVVQAVRVNQQLSLHLRLA